MTNQIVPHPSSASTTASTTARTTHGADVAFGPEGADGPACAPCGRAVAREDAVASATATGPVPIGGADQPVAVPGSGDDHAVVAAGAGSDACHPVPAQY